MLEGLHRLKPSKDVRAPITLPMLNQIISALPTLCSNDYEATLSASAFKLAFFGLLRVSEFTVSSSKATTLSFCDVRVSDTEIQFFLKGSKTDQLCKGATVQIAFNSETSALFFHMQQYLAIRPHGEGPFFCHLNGKPLTSYQFTAILTRSIKFIGLDTSVFKSHSFRIGGATHLYQKGVPEEEIKLKGRWKSNAMYSYIRI